MQSYFSSCIICTKLDNKVFNLCAVKYEVRQGSVLGPILFLLYVNNLPNVSKFEATLFADGANLHLSHSNIATLQTQVAEKINKIDKWMNFNELTINYKQKLLHDCEQTAVKNS